MINLSSSLNQASPNRQPSQHILKPEQRVYLYGDTKFTGTLIRPLERTYPSRWTVQLDIGGYDSATVAEITPIASYPVESNSQIPFNDEPEPTNSELEREIIALKKENERLIQENQQLNEKLAEAKQIIRLAKDISPIMRISLKRVLRLAHRACMDVKRTIGGWILKMGSKARMFRRLADIWAILSQDEWHLSDIFAPDKLIPLDKIKPPRQRELPATYYPRMPKQPFPITREDLLKERELKALRFC